MQTSVLKWACALCLLITGTSLGQSDLIYSFSSGPGDEIRVVGANGADKGALVSPTTGNSPFGLGQAGVNGKIYWTDIIADVIYQANADGSNESVAFSTVFAGDTGATVQSISIDAVNSRVFWGDSTNDAIRVANLDGSNGSTIYTSSADAGSPNGVFYDAAAERVLWGDNTGDAIMQYDLVTNVVSTLVDLDLDVSDGSYVPKGVAANGSNIFFGDSGPDKIWQADADGSNVVELVDLPTFYASNGNFGDADSNSVINELTLIDNVLYWTEGNAGKRGIYGYDLATSNAFQLLDTGLINSGAAPLKIAAYTFVVPEPGSVVVLALAGVGLVMRRRRM